MIGLDRQERFELGRRRGLPGRSVTVRERELFRHGLLVGTTGAGKTTAALALCAQLIDAGWGVVMIDLKADPANAATLADCAAGTGAPFHQFVTTPGGQCDLWRPLASGDANARMSRVICLSEWSEPYYRAVCERFCQLAFVVMERARIEPSFRALISLLDSPGTLMNLIERLDPADRAPATRYVLALLKDTGQRSGLAGLAARLGTLCDVGGPLHGLDGRSSGEHAGLDLTALGLDGGVAYFGLDSARSAVTAAQLAALAVLDVQAMVAERIAAGPPHRPVMVYIDEFSAIDGDHMLGLFARARSASVAMLVATQELADLARVDTGFCDQIVGLTGTKLIMRQEVSDSADTFARIIGTHTVTRRTEQVGSSVFGLGRSATGAGSERRVEEFIVHPNTIKRLRMGEAIALRKDPFRCDRIRIRPPDLPV